MSGAKITINALVSGPIADGSAQEAIRDWLDASKKDVAQAAIDLLHAYTMDKTGRATGHYQEMIRSTVLAYNDILVNDPVVYGPWLEGSSKRNRSTRFKGYRLWRTTRQQIQKQAPDIAQARLADYADRIGITELGV